jgi:2-polyprenyl-3-methyl-5-hydroxy-6-metoxy-1,4-benzoquinol methylase
MTTELSTSVCLVCGSASMPKSRLDALLLQCSDCTFVWTAGESAAPEELYDSSYFEGEGYEDYYDPRARRFESQLRLRWLLSTGRPDTLLEAGSAGGFFIEAANKSGIEACGVEISASAAGYARGTLGVEVRQGYFETSDFAEPFDVVCAFHVLEHVENPTEFLQAARDRLVPGGRLALEVPNISSAAAGRLGLAWPHIQPEYHRWHFTPESLRRLIKDCGFEVVKADTIFSRFYWQTWARRRNARSLFIADLAASHRPWVTHPTMGDAIRLVANR